METTMSNIQTLIDQTFSYAVEAGAEGNHDLAKSYSDDWAEFIEIKYLIDSGYTLGAAKSLDEMDTLPREQFVMAMVADGYDVTKYGFIVN